MTVLVATRDATQAVNDSWVYVRLIITRVRDFCFADAANASAAVLSNGVHICWFDGIVGLDFSHFADPPDNLDELRTSKFFATGFWVDWTVETY